MGSAYQSDESGRNEIFARPFVPPGAGGAAAGAAGGRWQVSTAGGVFPVWWLDGKELDYLNPTGAMIAAPITVSGSTLEPGAPVVLFPTRVYGGGADIQQSRQYDVGSDGRFIINSELDSAAAPITLLQHWNPEALAFREPTTKEARKTGPLCVLVRKGGLVPEGRAQCATAERLKTA